MERVKITEDEEKKYALFTLPFSNTNPSEGYARITRVVSRYIRRRGQPETQAFFNIRPGRYWNILVTLASISEELKAALERFDFVPLNLNSLNEFS